MNDKRFRDSERRWQSTASGEDEVTHLAERRRCGELTTERLEIAAHCGHTAARQVLGLGAPPPVESRAEWIRGLARFEPEVRMRAAVAAAWFWANALLEREELTEVAWVVLERLDQFLERPQAALLAEVQTYTAALEDERSLLEAEGTLHGEELAAAIAIERVAVAFRQWADAHRTRPALRDPAEFVVHILQGSESETGESGPASPETTVRQETAAAPRGTGFVEAIQAELVGWSLGRPRE